MKTEISLINVGEFISRRLGQGQQKTIFIRETREKFIVKKVELDNSI